MYSKIKISGTIEVVTGLSVGAVNLVWLEQLIPL